MKIIDLMDGEYRDMARRLIASCADLVGEDPECTSCKKFSYQGAVDLQYFNPKAAEGMRPMQNHTGYIIPCEPCKVRKPYTWVAKIPVQVLADFLKTKAAGTGAWAISELEALVPVKRGFEFL